MNNTDEDGFHTVLLIGGRDAGKSNFLFRLWIAIDGGDGALVKDGLPSEIGYLRAGSAELLEAAFAERSGPDLQERVGIPVKASVGLDTLRGLLVAPDVAGEQVLAIFRTRQWSSDWESLISARCACLLFIRAGSDEIVAPLDWVTCIERFGTSIGPKPAMERAAAVPVGSGGSDARDPENEATGERGACQASEPEDEEPPELPTQVVLIEWLQFLRRAFTAIAGGAFRPRVGIVISAWDAVPSDQQPNGPGSYVKENFPMLYDFIQANDERFEFQMFGVSIVAGDLKNDEEFREEYRSGRPRDFGYVLHSLSGSLAHSRDITLPVAWALRFLRELI